MLENNPEIPAPEAIEIFCEDCKNPFPFTAGEQAFYAARALFPPKRCPVCRLKRKQKMEQHGKNR